MQYKLRGIIKKNSILISNFSHLSALQLLNIALQLISYPYLIRVLGKENYGLIIFAEAIVSYLVILVGFGFNISAIKQISINRDDKNKIEEIVSSVLIIKGLLFMISLGLLFIILFFIKEAENNHLLFFLTIWMCLYDFIYPSWYFQGIEKMKYLTFVTLGGRLFFLILIFVFIQKPSDFILVPVINGGGAIITGVIALFIIFKKHKIQFYLPNFKTIIFYFNDSVSIFISNISTKLYTSTTKVIIGTFIGMSEVAYFDLAEKITSVFRIPQTIFTTTLFPKITIEKNVKFVLNLFKYSIGFNLILYIVIFLLAEYFVKILGGVGLTPATNIVRIVGLTIPITAISSVFGLQILIPFGYSKIYSKIVVYSALFYFFEILFALLLLNEINILVISTITIITESFIALLMFINCYRNKLIKI